jgi:hypothetical protein
MSFWDKIKKLFGWHPPAPPAPVPVPVPVPIPPPVPPAPPKQKLGLGYFYLDGRYGDWWAQPNIGANTYCDVYHAWWQMAYWKNTAEPYDTDGAGWKYTMRGAVRRAFTAGKRIILAIDVDRPGTPSYRECLKLMAPFWERVWLIDLFVECDWTSGQADAQVGRVKNALRELGLPLRPIGITLEVKQALTSELVNARSIDWWGVELYQDPAGQNDVAGEIAQRIKAYARQVAARVPGRGLVFVGQAYDRNGAWTNMETLRRLQWPTYEIALELKALALLWFAYGREQPDPSRPQYGGGVHFHPVLSIEHKKIAANVAGGN